MFLWIALFFWGGIIGIHKVFLFLPEDPFGERINQKTHRKVFYFFYLVLSAPFMFGLMLGAFIQHTLKKEQDELGMKTYVLIKSP